MRTDNGGGSLPEARSHQAVVDGWLQRRKAAGLPREVLLELFESALARLWAHTSTSLGEVTLAAIADRVLHNAGEKFPAFGSLSVESTGRLRSGELRRNTESLSHRDLLEGMRFVLVEFLTVLGNLTAGLLTPELHHELEGVEPGRSSRQSSRAPGTSTERQGRA